MLCTDASVHVTSTLNHFYNGRDLS